MSRFPYILKATVPDFVERARKMLGSVPVVEEVASYLEAHPEDLCSTGISRGAFATPRSWDKFMQMATENPENTAALAHVWLGKEISQSFLAHRSGEVVTVSANESKATSMLTSRLEKMRAADDGQSKVPQSDAEKAAGVTPTSHSPGPGRFVN